MSLIPKGYRHRGVWLFRYKNIVNGSRERDITYTVHFILTLIECLNDKFVTVHKKYSKSHEEQAFLSHEFQVVAYHRSML
jgi:hypothetical protein